MTLADFTTPSPARRGQFVGRVVQNQPLCREHFKLVLALDHFPPTEPGQFIQIACNEITQTSNDALDLDWSPGQRSSIAERTLLQPVAVLRRPFSLAGRNSADGKVLLEVIHRVVGIGTDWLSQLRVGAQVGILGPLGNHFRLPSEEETPIMVGGGVGIPPMLYLATALQSRGGVACCGATTKDLLCLSITGDSDSAGAAPRPCIEEFARHNVNSLISTDDGSYGFRGFVTQVLEKYLDANPNRRFVIYTCGPEIMMKRVADIAIARNIPCQIAVERAMACGMGTCQSCCIKVKKPDPAAVPLPGREWCYRLACTDGPVFSAKDLLW